MLLLTQYSDSHRHLVEQFISPNCYLFDNIQMIHMPQVCESGTYGKPGFKEHMYMKLDCLLDVPLNTPTLYVDADCLILPTLATWSSEWLANNPNKVGCGNDSDTHSMGVLLFTQTKETMEWWLRLKHTAESLGIQDQEALNWIIKHDKPTANLTLLPKDIIANWSPGDPWKGEPINPPPEMLCWHANFCIGVHNKTMMLEMVQQCLQ